MSSVNSPLKHRGFRQGLYQQSATAKEVVGQMRSDGFRWYRYCKAGASGISKGKLQMQPPIDAGVVDETCPATAKGEVVLNLTVTAGAAFVAGDLKGGMFMINDADEEGLCVPIEGNDVLGASGTALNIELAHGLPVALLVTSEFTIVPPLGLSVVETATEENVPVGVPLIDVTALYYHWEVFRGITSVLTVGTPAVGSMLTPGTMAGSVIIMNATLDVDMFAIGRTIGIAGADGEYYPILLEL